MLVKQKSKKLTENQKEVMNYAQTKQEEVINTIIAGKIIAVNEGKGHKIISIETGNKIARIQAWDAFAQDVEKKYPIGSYIIANVSTVCWQGKNSNGEPVSGIAQKIKGSCIGANLMTVCGVLTNINNSRGFAHKPGYSYFTLSSKEFPLAIYCSGRCELIDKHLEKGVGTAIQVTGNVIIQGDRLLLEDCNIIWI